MFAHWIALDARTLKFPGGNFVEPPLKRLWPKTFLEEHILSRFGPIFSTFCVDKMTPQFKDEVILTHRGNVVHESVARSSFSPCSYVRS